MVWHGVPFSAHLILAVGPLDDAVALVVHPYLLALSKLYTGLAIVPAALLQVVESAGIALLDGVLKRGHPLGAVSPALGAVSSTAPAASAATAAPAPSLVAVLILRVLAILFVPVWLPFGGTCLP